MKSGTKFLALAACVALATSITSCTSKAQATKAAQDSANSMLTIDYASGNTSTICGPAKSLSDSLWGINVQSKVAGVTVTGVQALETSNLSVLGARFIPTGPDESYHMLDPATGELLDMWDRENAAVGTVVSRERTNLLLHVKMKNPGNVAKSSGIRINFEQGSKSYSLVSHFSLTLKQSC